MDIISGIFAMGLTAIFLYTLLNPSEEVKKRIEWDYEHAHQHDHDQWWRW